MRASEEKKQNTLQKPTVQAKAASGRNHSADPSTPQGMLSEKIASAAPQTPQARLIRLLSGKPDTGQAVQRQEESSTREEEPLQKQSQSSSGSSNPASGASGSPEKMSGSYRSKMETAFGADFSGITIHRNAPSAKSMNALAYTQGEHIHFAPGQYDPGSKEGQTLLGHELTHVVQQRQGRVQATTQAKGMPINDNPALEKEADDMGEKVAQGKFDSTAALRPGAKAGTTTSMPLQRSVTDTPTDYKDAAALKGMTLFEFDDYAKKQADWHAGPKLTAPDIQLVREVMLFGRSADYLSACGLMTISDINKEIGNHGLAGTKQYLKVYGKAVSNQIPFQYQPMNDPAKAIQAGKDMDILMTAFPPFMLKSAMKQWIFDHLQGNNYISDLANYYTTASPNPNFEATNGMDFASYNNMKSADKVDPITFHNAPLKGNIRNFHRFEKAALDKLIVNFGDTSKAKPLTLILHTAIDHNGAFHRDPNLTKVITNWNNLTIMIEGKETLADVQSEIGPLAKKYGRNDRIDQVMIAGHGNARSIQLAGKVQDDGSGRLEEVNDAVDLKKNKIDADALILEVLKNMDDRLTAKNLQPHRRIIFNACLTNSNAVQAAITATNLPAAKIEIKNYIKNNASLATYVQSVADGRKNKVTSLGSNASFGSEVELIDKTTGKLDLISKVKDPKLTAPKLEYVEFGTEPSGALRAALESWANDAPKCITAMQNRVAKNPTDWDGILIKSLYNEILTNYLMAPEGIRHCSISADVMGELKNEAECRVANFYGIEKHKHLTLPHFKILHTSTEWTSSPYIPLVMYQAWMTADTADAHPRTQFLTTLQGHFNCNTARKYVDIAYLDTNGHFADLFKSKGEGQLILALLGVLDSNQADCKAYLISELNASDRFDAAKKITEKLSGLATEDDILITIGKLNPPAMGGSGSANKDANVRLGADTENKDYVESVTYIGEISASLEAEVFEKADTSSKKLTALAKASSIDIIGASGVWWAIAYENAGKQGTAFVRQSDVTLK